MQLIFPALLAALCIWSCEGGKECRPRVSAFLNCVRSGEADTRGFEAPTFDEANAMVRACYERLDCIRTPNNVVPWSRHGSTVRPNPDNSPYGKIAAAAEKCYAGVRGSLVSEMEKCMQSSEQGWTDFKIPSEKKDSSSNRDYLSWLPLYSSPPSSPVFNFHYYEVQLDEAFSTGSSCSDSQRKSLVSCLEGVGQKLYPTCENPLQTKLRHTEHKAGYCNRIEACTAEASLSQECESELSEIPDSLCKCAVRVDDARKRHGNGIDAKLLKCVESKLDSSFVMEFGRAWIRRALENSDAPSTDRFCQYGLHNYRRSQGEDIRHGPWDGYGGKGGRYMNQMRGLCK